MTDPKVDCTTLEAAHQALFRIATELERAEARRDELDLDDFVRGIQWDYESLDLVSPS